MRERALNWGEARGERGKGKPRWNREIQGQTAVRGGETTHRLSPTFFIASVIERAHLRDDVFIRGALRTGRELPKLLTQIQERPEQKEDKAEWKRQHLPVYSSIEKTNRNQLPFWRRDIQPVSKCCEDASLRFSFRKDLTLGEHERGKERWASPPG